MAYKAEISRKNPGCFLFLVDQSESMEDPFGGKEKNRRKAEELATILNKLLHNLSIRCAKSDAIYDYFHVGVVGYSEETAKPVLGGELAGRALVPISELANKPLRIDERSDSSKDDSSAKVKSPVWFDPFWKGGTPMCAALNEATRIVKGWVAEHPAGFPPIVINISDGDSTDGDPTSAASELTSVSSDDGHVLLFNVHLSGEPGQPVELPSKPDNLPDKFAKQLFTISSMLTPFMVSRAKELGMTVEDDSRGFIFNAQPMQVIHFLDIGTRPAQVHLR